MSKNLPLSSDTKGSIEQEVLLLTYNERLSVSPNITDTDKIKWQQRLGKFIDAEYKQLITQRIRGINNAVIIVCLFLGLFSLWFEPSYSPFAFMLFCGVLTITVITFPLWLLISRQNRAHRDNLARMLYDLNYEVEYTDTTINLVNRSTFQVIARTKLKG